MQNLAGMLENGDPETIYRHLVSQGKEPEDVVIGGREPKGALWDATLARELPELIPRLQLVDLVPICRTTSSPRSTAPPWP